MVMGGLSFSNCSGVPRVFSSPLLTSARVASPLGAVHSTVSSGAVWVLSAELLSPPLSAAGAGAGVETTGVVVVLAAGATPLGAAGAGAGVEPTGAAGVSAAVPPVSPFWAAGAAAPVCELSAPVSWDTGPSAEVSGDSVPSARAAVGTRAQSISAHTSSATADANRLLVFLVLSFMYIPP